jgi:predicted component of type VI protein secretion system
MKTYSIEKSNGGTERVDGDSFIVASAGILEVVTIIDAKTKTINVVAMYADKYWRSIKEVK